MKNYLMIACAALAMIGCAHNNRGGVGDDSQSEIGSDQSSERKTTYDRNFKMPKSNEYKGAPGDASTSERSSGAGSLDNQTPPSETPPPQN